MACRTFADRLSSTVPHCSVWGTGERTEPLIFNSATELKWVRAMPVRQLFRPGQLPRINLVSILGYSSDPVARIHDFDSRLENH